MRYDSRDWFEGVEAERSTNAVGTRAIRQQNVRLLQLLLRAESLIRALESENWELSRDLLVKR